MKILLCSDATTNAQLAMLQGLGYKLINNEGTPSIFFAKYQPDLILLDIDIYEEKVIGTIRQAKENAHWTPILVISCNEEKIEKALQLGADDYLNKPIKSSLLKNKIQAMQRLQNMKENLLDFGKQLKEVNEKLLTANQILAELNLKDPLTRTGNRRAFEENLTRVARLSRRENKPFSLLMVDIDQFKSFNETYGHQAGDRALQQLSSVLKRGVHRASDFVARYEGQRFAIILTDTLLAGALHVAKRLTMALELLQIAHSQTERGLLTISIGVVSSTMEGTVDTLLSCVNLALKQAKQAGGGKVVGSNVQEGDLQIESLYQKEAPFSSSGSSSKH